MRKRVYAGLLSIILMLAMLPQMPVMAIPVPEGIWTDYAADSFEQGQGTENDPYQISSAKELAYLATIANAGTMHLLNSYFVLTKDIDLSAHRWVPIGEGENNQGRYFEGYFDGQGHTITGMYVDESERNYVAGLFGRVTNDTIISNLTIQDACVKTAGGSSAGIFAGCIQNEGITIRNCHVSGTVTCDKTAGGFVGYSSYVEFENCSAQVQVTGEGTDGGCIGGFVGEAYNSHFTGCSAEGDVEGTYSCGGFGGILWSNTTADNCLADVDVNAKDWNTGGFVGYIEEAVTISNCGALGNVTNPVINVTTRLGGFVGCIYWETSKCKIENSFAAGIVSGGNDEHPAGGFVGYMDSDEIIGCAFNAEKNPSLQAVGESIGEEEKAIDAGSSSQVLGKICSIFDHKAGQPEKIAPTCTENGANGVIKCERCGMILESGTIVAATGHHYKDGKCTVCGAADPNYKEPIEIQQPSEISEIIYVNGISISGISNQIAAGKKILLSAAITPLNASDQRLIWSSSIIRFN